MLLTSTASEKEISILLCRHHTRGFCFVFCHYGLKRRKQLILLLPSFLSHGMAKLIIFSSYFHPLPFLPFFFLMQLRLKSNLSTSIFLPTPSPLRRCPPTPFQKLPVPLSTPTIQLTKSVSLHPWFDAVYLPPPIIPAHRTSTCIHEQLLFRLNLLTISLPK